MLHAPTTSLTLIILMYGIFYITWISVQKILKIKELEKRDIGFIYNKEGFQNVVYVKYDNPEGIIFYDSVNKHTLKKTKEIYFTSR
jgi:threonine/homoserine/homoserine lactone efflux protein